MRFVSYLVSLTLIGLCSTRAMGQTAKPGQKDGTAKESAIRKGIFAEGTPLNQKRLEELLTAHRASTLTTNQKLDEECGKAKVKVQDRKTCMRGLLGSDWRADQGRLVLKGAVLRGANLERADLGGANLERAVLTGANLKGADSGWAHLEGIVLGGANLEGAKLGDANLEGAYLWSAHLEGAVLVGANLKGADLRWAHLEGAKLRNANLEGADLGGTHLEEAYLWDANLEGADLGGAHLERAKLRNANLEGVKLWNANLEGALYEPKLGGLPEIVSLRTAENLETMRFGNSPHALEDLRREFKRVGYKDQERQITYAIKRSEQLNAEARADLSEAYFNHVFFDLPVAYGLRPGRALWILVWLIPGFALFYGVAIWKPLRNHGLYRLLPQERIETKYYGAKVADAVKLEQLPRDWRHALRYAVYFSMLSAFHIGWRELNVGNWISRLCSSEPIPCKPPVGYAPYPGCNP